MSTTMNALSSPSIRHAEFVRLTMPAAVYTFCNAAGPITIGGLTFSGLGSLLQIGDIQRDIKATSDDLTLSLTGIDPENVGVVLSADIKGSLVEVWRGFLDDNNQIETISGQVQFFKRYQGIINSTSITEEFNDELRSRIATCTIACASFRTVLQNRIAGIKTNQVNWQQIYGADTSMNRVGAIAAQFFDFGRAPMTATQSTPALDTTGGIASTTVDTSGA